MFKVGDKITPVSLSGTSFKDSKLVIKANVAVISPSWKSYFFELFFQILAWGGLFFMINDLSYKESSDEASFIIFVTVFCFIFSGIVRFIFYRIRKNHHFDKNVDTYYVGKVLDTESVIKLSEIQILHLISKEIYSSGKSYTSFELSFCTFCGQRVVVMNHSDYYSIKLDMERLSKFLKVPVESLRNGAIYQ